MQSLNTLEMDQVAGGSAPKTVQEALQESVTESLKAIGRSNLPFKKKLQAMEDFMRDHQSLCNQSIDAVSPSAT